MATYRIEFTKPADKAFQALPRDVQRRVARKVDVLAVDPRPAGTKALQDVVPLTYRLRVGDYRVLYTVQDDVLLVLVVKVGNRREVYDR